MTDTGGDLPLDKKRVMDSIRNRKLLESANHYGWSVSSYVGPSLSKTPEGLEGLQFTGIATNEDYEEVTVRPDLDACATAMQIVFDDKATVIWTAKTRSLLTRKIKQTFNGFDWRRDKNVE